MRTIVGNRNRSAKRKKVLGWPERSLRTENARGSLI
jgi:hypothetical protein